MVDALKSVLRPGPHLRRPVASALRAWRLTMIGVGVLVVIFLIACATTLMVLRHQAGRQEKELNAAPTWPTP